MKSYIFGVVIKEDTFQDGTAAYHAYCPALRGCHTWGQTSGQALVNIQEAAELYVEDLIESNDSIPVDLENGVEQHYTHSVIVRI